MEEIQWELEAEQKEATQKAQEKLDVAKAQNERCWLEKKRKEDEEC